MYKAILLLASLLIVCMTNTQTNSKPKTQSTTMVAINQQQQIDTTTSPNVRAMIQILRNKQKYIGQPFSMLLKDLPDAIKYFYPVPDFDNSFLSSSFIFGFIDFKETFLNMDHPSYSLYKRAILVIDWEIPIKRHDLKNFLSEYNNWNKESEDFFNLRIIQNIELGEPIEVSKAGGWLNWP